MDVIISANVNRFIKYFHRKIPEVASYVQYNRLPFHLKCVVQYSHCNHQAGVDLSRARRSSKGCTVVKLNCQLYRPSRPKMSTTEDGTQSSVGAMPRRHLKRAAKF